MELYQLNYFVEIVRSQGLNSAARHLGISPPALSKAIQNLETELRCALFLRRGQKLELTAQGQHLFSRAQEMLGLEARTRDELGGMLDTPELILVGRELLLAEFGDRLIAPFKKAYPSARIVLHSESGARALEEVDNDRAHIALSIQPPPEGWRREILGELDFATCVGPGHALYSSAARGKAVPIGEVLKHGFVSPNLPLFGKISSQNTIDGWRDDIHPRRIDFVVEDLLLIRNILESGQALAYIPRVWADSLDVKTLKVTGCSFRAEVSVYASAKRDGDYGWLSRLMDSLKRRAATR